MSQTVLKGFKLSAFRRKPKRTVSGKLWFGKLREELKLLVIKGRRSYKMAAAIKHWLPKISSRTSLHAGEVEAKKIEFLSYQNLFVDQILSQPFLVNEMPDVGDYWSNVIEHNVKNTHSAGFISYLTCCVLSEEDQALTDQRKKAAAALGFSWNLLHTCFNMHDEIVQVAEKGRDKDKSWFSVAGIKMMALNDARSLERNAVELIKNNCKGCKNLALVLELFQEGRLTAMAARCYESLTERGRDENWPEQCTKENYDKIVKYRTMNPSFHLPMMSAMLVAEWDDKELMSEIKQVLKLIAAFCHAKQEFGGFLRHGTLDGAAMDIEDGKLTWMLMKTLERGTPEQKQALMDNYGFKDTLKVQEVQKLYRDLNLTAVFQEFRMETMGRLREEINGRFGFGPIGALLLSFLRFV